MGEPTYYHLVAMVFRVVKKNTESNQKGMFGCNRLTLNSLHAEHACRDNDLKTKGGPQDNVEEETGERYREFSTR